MICRQANDHVSPCLPPRDKLCVYLCSDCLFLLASRPSFLWLWHFLVTRNMHRRLMAQRALSALIKYPCLPENPLKLFFIVTNLNVFFFTIPYYMLFNRLNVTHLFVYVLI